MSIYQINSIMTLVYALPILVFLLLLRKKENGIKKTMYLLEEIDEQLKQLKTIKNKLPKP